MLNTILTIIVSVTIFGVLFFLIVKRMLKKKIRFLYKKKL